MDEDRSKGKAKDVAGSAKEKFGKATGDKETERSEGRSGRGQGSEGLRKGQGFPSRQEVRSELEGRHRRCRFPDRSGPSACSRWSSEREPAWGPASASIFETGAPL